MSDKETSVPFEKPSSLHEYDSDHYSSSSGRTLSDKSDNKKILLIGKKSSSDDIAHQEIAAVSSGVVE